MNKMELEIGEKFLVIEFYGELDNSTSAPYKEKITATIIKNRSEILILDFKSVTFIDSSGLGLVLGRYNQMKEINGRLYITGVSTYVDKLFKMSGMWNIIRKFNSIDEVKEMVGIKI